MGCAGKAERCGSKCARAHLDSAKKASLWLDCGLQGERLRLQVCPRTLGQREEGKPLA